MIHPPSHLPYTLLRSRRKSLGLQIQSDGTLIARAPMHLSIHEIERFISMKQNWIQKHQARIKERSGGKSKKSYSEAEVLQMKNHLKEYLIPRVRTLWESTGFPVYTHIKVTKSERRWGSCSGKNGLCFSYRLAEYLENDRDIIDAIIAHEIVHLKVKNHSKRFWDALYELMPDYEQRVRALH